AQRTRHIIKGSLRICRVGKRSAPAFLRQVKHLAALKNLTSGNKRQHVRGYIFHFNNNRH
ncbi:hypothetical protein ACT0CE_004391, partial [Cronobacter sakazakii]